MGKRNGLNKRSVLYLLVLATLLTVGDLMAGWSGFPGESNLFVGSVDRDYAPKLVSDGDNGCLVFYLRENEDGNATALGIQRIDSNGGRMWDEADEDYIISPNIKVLAPLQRSFQVAATDGGTYVVYIDQVSQTLVANIITVDGVSKQLWGVDATDVDDFNITPFATSQFSGLAVVYCSNIQGIIKIVAIIEGNPTEPFTVLSGHESEVWAPLVTPSIGSDGFADALFVSYIGMNHLTDPPTPQVYCKKIVGVPMAFPEGQPWGSTETADGQTVANATNIDAIQERNVYKIFSYTNQSVSGHLCCIYEDVEDDYPSLCATEYASDGSQIGGLLVIEGDTFNGYFVSKEPGAGNAIVAYEYKLVDDEGTEWIKIKVRQLTFGQNGPSSGPATEVSEQTFWQNEKDPIIEMDGSSQNSKPVIVYRNDFGGSYFNVCAQKISPYGVNQSGREWGDNGVRVTDSTSNHHLISVIRTESLNFIASWANEEDDNIYGGLINRKGALGPDISPPAAAAKLVDFDSSMITWKSNPEDAIESYTVQKCAQLAIAPQGGVTCLRWDETPLAVLPPNVHSFTHEGLTEDSVYMYRVKAERGGLSTPSNGVSLSTVALFPPTDLVLKGYQIERVLGDGTVVNFRLAFTDNSAREEGFKIMVNHERNGEIIANNSIQLGENETEFGDSLLLKRGDIIEYQVVAYAGEDTSEPAILRLQASDFISDPSSPESPSDGGEDLYGGSTGGDIFRSKGGRLSRCYISTASHGGVESNTRRLIHLRDFYIRKDVSGALFVSSYEHLSPSTSFTLSSGSFSHKVTGLLVDTVSTTGESTRTAIVITIAITLLLILTRLTTARRSVVEKTCYDTHL